MRTLEKAKAQCPVPVAGLVEVREIERAGRLHDQINDLIDATLAILQEARQQGDSRMSLSAIREARGNLELLAKITGQWNPAREPERAPSMFIFPPGSEPNLFIGCDVELVGSDPPRHPEKLIETQAALVEKAE